MHSLADVALEQAHMIVLGQRNEGRERKRSVALFLLSDLISFAFPGLFVGLISAELWTTETLMLWLPAFNGIYYEIIVKLWINLESDPFL